VRIEDFMLSCRVQGRFVEQAFFNELVRRDVGVCRVWVNFHPTGRNLPAQQVLQAIGFEELPGGTGMALDPRNTKLDCDFIDIRCQRVAGDEARMPATV
jgi:predicted enzyme involved in methoxymalonyl-ACP biosynthesis